jgi:hypothetical protein
MKQPIFNGSIEDYEKMSLNDLNIQEDILYDKYKLVREVRRYKELKGIYNKRRENVA